MRSSTSGCESGRERSCESKGSHSRRHRGRSSRHRNLSREGGKDFWKKFLKHKEGKHKDKEREGKGEVKMAVSILCQDMQPLHQAVVTHLVRDALKGKGPKEERRRDRKYSKERKCPAERVKEVTKEVLKNKEKIVETTDLIMGTIKESMPKIEETKEKEGKLHGGYKRFAKETARMITKMWRKGITDKEQQKKLVQKYLAKTKRKHMKGMLKGAKEVVEKILFYEIESCDPLYRKAIEKVVADAFVTHCFLKMTVKRKEMKEFKEKVEQKKEDGEKPWQHRRRGPHFGRFMKGEKMGGKKMIQEKLLKKGLKFVLNYYKANEENIKTCFEAIKPIIEEQFKDCKNTCRTGEEIISKALRAAGEEKKGKEFYVDFAKKYIKGCVTPCHKGCVKRCEGLVKAGLLFNGIKDKCVICIASRWGAIACCQVNGKNGCASAECADFIKKWITEHLPAVTEAAAIVDEMVKELSGLPLDSEMKAKFISKMTSQYLAMNCADGKLNKDDLKALLKKFKEGIDKTIEGIRAEAK